MSDYGSLKEYQYIHFAITKIHSWQYGQSLALSLLKIHECVTFVNIKLFMAFDNIQSN